MLGGSDCGHTRRVFCVVAFNVLIRPEIPDDYRSIAEINVAAFGSPVEATLVEQLRAQGLVIASLVAVDDLGQIVGHILFSPVTIVTSGGSKMQVASLAPMCVLPPYQRKGIGSILVEQGIEACRRANYRAIVLVGHHAYYPRFGFSHAFVAGLENPFAADEAFMGLELVPGALSGIQGRVVYPDLFSQFS